MVWTFCHLFRKISLNLKTPKWKSNKHGKQYALFACLKSTARKNMLYPNYTGYCGFKINMTTFFKRNICT